MSVGIAKSIVAPFNVSEIVFSYPDGAVADAIEAQVARSLPEVSGLELAQTPAQRAAVFQETIERQRAAFVDLHGDAFGYERRTEDRKAATAKFEPALAVFGAELG